MPLFWLAYSTPEGKTVVIVEASAGIYARMDLKVAALECGGKPEIHELPPDKPVPKSKIGKPLSAEEATILIERWARPKRAPKAKSTKSPSKQPPKRTVLRRRRSRSI